MIFVLFLSCKVTTQNKEMRIEANTTIYVGANEPGPLKRAVEDLAMDMEKVFGATIKVVNDLSQCSENTILVTLNEDLPETIEKPTGREKLMIKIVRNPFETSSIKNATVLTGSDMRGAIFAVYRFSEKFLNVDPLYWWNDNVPKKMEYVSIPIDFEEKSNSPTIKYRGLFINDEDLLSGWKSGTWGISGISEEAWDRIYEATLRMKGNMITPGTFIFPYEPQVKAASERGLIITQHHIEVLGLNTFRWPDDVTYSFHRNKEKLISAWTKSVEQYPKGMEILWTVGYRGRHDRAFWADDKDFPKSKQARADIIKEAILTQMEIVKKRYKNPYFIMNTWGEGIEFVKEGYLELPEEVTLVWADKGWGIIRDGGTIAEGQGVYYHTAMFSQRCNQLTEMIPLKRIQEQIGRAVKAKATEYLLVNCSDLRPVLMSTKAALDIGWDATKWVEDSNHHNLFLKEWCVDQFGEDVAEKVAEIYKRYEEVPIKYGKEDHDRFGDNYYHLLTRSYLRRMSAGGEETYIERLGESYEAEPNARLLVDLAKNAIQPWDELLADAEELYASIPGDRQGFYQAHILMPITLHKHSNKILLNTMKAFLSDSSDEQLALIDDSLLEIPPILASFEKAEYGKWKDFYLNDLMTGVRSTRKVLEISRKVINNEPNYEDPSDYMHGYQMWNMVKGYQGTQKTPM